MKKKIIIIVFVIVFIIVCYLIFGCFRKRNVNVSNVTYFNYSYSVGYHYEASIVYKLELSNNKYRAIIKDEGKTIEEARKYDVDRDFVLKIEKILNKYKVYSWDGFNKSDKNVLDGDSFELNVKFSNKSISARGYMKWPRNYDLFVADINKLFEELGSAD